MQKSHTLAFIPALAASVCVAGEPLLPVRGTTSVSIETRNIQLSGNPLGETPIFLGFANMGIGPWAAYALAKQDAYAAREQNLGISYQGTINVPMIGTITLKPDVEHKEYPAAGKTMYVADLLVGSATPLGNVNLFYREILDTEDFDSGRTAILGIATSSLDLGSAGGFSAYLKGTGSLAYQDDFAGKVTGLAYVTPGISLGIRKGTTSIESFLKYQDPLDKGLDPYTYGGLKITKDFGKK